MILMNYLDLFQTNHKLARWVVLLYISISSKDNMYKNKDHRTMQLHSVLIFQMNFVQL